MQDKHQSCEKLDHETTLCFSEPGVNKAILYPQTRSLLAQLQREHQLSFLSSFFMSWQAFILPMLTAPWCVISVSRDSGIQFFRGLRMVHDVQCVQRELLPAATSSLWEPSVNRPAGPYCHHKASFSSWSPKGNQWAQTAQAELGDCFALLKKQRNIWKKPSIPIPCRQKASPRCISRHLWAKMQFPDILSFPTQGKTL